MQLENTFTVPVDIDTVYDALNDPEKVTPCFPGAALTSQDGDDFTGTVKVKLGPISMTYKGKGTFVERDKASHKVVVDAQGRDSRGNGTASAKATLTMVDAGSGQTKVTVLTEMQVTGKPAQFGRGVMADVGDKILGQFASCLADEFADAMAAAVCHKVFDRHPVLRFASIENGASWVPYLFYQFKDVYSKMPQEFPEDPIEAFKRCVYVAPFWEDDFAKMADLCGVDRIIFGSDWPHPEGMSDPITLVEDLQGLDEEGQRKVMGGNMIDLFKVPNKIVHKPDVPALVLA